MTALWKSAGLAIALAMLLGRAGPAAADEGMWTFDAFPSAKVQAAYGFAPDRAWLDRVRLASLRLARGCSGAIVSPEGLVQTNHHCARSCVQQISTAKADYNAGGFYAKRPEDEVRCPDVEADQLIAILDVTPRIAAATQDREGADFAAAYTRETAAIAKACAGGDSHLRCDIVNLYHGGRFSLYKYMRYQDVRLVFAPEEAVAFFGGDPDNFEFPRYDFDVSYMRLYADGKPLKTGDYMPYAAEDAKEGELTFVSGNPGSTSRLATLAQLEYQRNVELPRTLFYLAELRGRLQQFGSENPEHARIANRDLFSTENAFKGLKGRLAALGDPDLMAEKAEAERSLRTEIAADPKLAAEVGPAWDKIAAATAHLAQIRNAYVMLEQGRGLRSELVADARYLVRHAAEAAKPEGQRLREYTEANFPILRQSLLSAAPVEPELEKLELGFALTKLREALGPDDPTVKAALGQLAPDQMAAALIDGTGLASPDTRRKLLAGGQAAIDASTDPLIAFVRRIDPAARAVRKDYEDNVEAVIDRNAGLIARARFGLSHGNLYPDATFTARLSFGAVAGYREPAPEGGMRAIAPFTQFRGLFARATGAAPFRLPQRWLDAQAALAPNQKMDFVTTNDIIGGNSGSPVVNREAEVVGLVFDGDIQSLSGDYYYDGATNRAVAVSIGALRMALDKVYHADRLMRELAPRG